MEALVWSPLKVFPYIGLDYLNHSMCCIYFKILKYELCRSLTHLYDGNEAGLGRVIPISFLHSIIQLFPILGTNPCWGRLIGSHPVNKRINNPIPTLSRMSISPNPNWQWANLIPKCTFLSLIMIIYQIWKNNIKVEINTTTINNFN